MVDKSSSLASSLVCLKEYGKYVSVHKNLFLFRHRLPESNSARILKVSCDLSINFLVECDFKWMCYWHGLITKIGSSYFFLTWISSGLKFIEMRVLYKSNFLSVLRRVVFIIYLGLSYDISFVQCLGEFMNSVHLEFLCKEFYSVFFICKRNITILSTRGVD